MKRILPTLLAVVLMASCSPNLEKLGDDILQQERMRAQVMAPKLAGVASISVDSMVFTHPKKPIQGHLATTWTLVAADSTQNVVCHPMEVQYINVEYGHASWTCNWLGAYAKLLAANIEQQSSTPNTEE